MALCLFTIQYHSMCNKLLPHNEEAMWGVVVNICSHIPFEKSLKSLERSAGRSGALYVETRGQNIFPLDLFSVFQQVIFLSP